ncbi:hypothetical protein [Thermogemmatispora sp.]|uniref:hypothetical protein n=1 Tax=Thermogemmatispora sp. TaxID=1968838 RepID=UPI0035E3F558
MGITNLTGPADTSSSLIIYSPEHLQQTAARILAEVSLAYQQHDAAWQQVQHWLNNEVDPAWAEVMRACLIPYVRRLRSSYDWLRDLASAMLQAADALEESDRQMASFFQEASQSSSAASGSRLPDHGLVP